MESLARKYYIDLCMNGFENLNSFLKITAVIAENGRWTIK